MRTLARLAVALYPRAWRRRYGEELEALLEEAAGGWRDLFDVMKGAVVMQLKILRAPLGGAVLGVVAGAVLYLMSPAAYASSAVIQLPASPARSLQNALASVFTDAESLGATHVVLEESSRNTAVVRITHFASDAGPAYSTAQALTAAASDDTGLTVVIEAPRMPTAAQRTGDPWWAAFGAVGGFLIGAAALVVGRKTSSEGRASR